MKFVRDRVGKRRAEHRDRRGEDKARTITVADAANGLDQRARAVEIDVHAFLEIELGLARNDGREMKDHIGPSGDRSGRGIGDVGRYGLDMRSGSFPGAAERSRRSA